MWSGPVLPIFAFFSTVDMLGCFWGSLSHSGTHLRASTWADIQCYSICEIKPQWKPSRTGGYEQPWIHLPCACSGTSQAPNFDFQALWCAWQTHSWPQQTTLSVDKGCPEGVLPISSSALPPATSWRWRWMKVVGESWILCCLHCLMLWLTFPLACSWWQQCLNIVKSCFQQLCCPGLPQHPFPCGTTSPGTAPLHRDCGCWRLPVLAKFLSLCPFPTLSLGMCIILCL